MSDNPDIHSSGRMARCVVLKTLADIHLEEENGRTSKTNGTGPDRCGKGETNPGKMVETKSIPIPSAGIFRDIAR
jgi:hypothetical protein